jgi:hypothetical protein
MAWLGPVLLGIHYEARVLSSTSSEYVMTKNRWGDLVQSLRITIALVCPVIQ